MTCGAPSCLFCGMTSFAAYLVVEKYVDQPGLFKVFYINLGAVRSMDCQCAFSCTSRFYLGVVINGMYAGVPIYLGCLLVLVYEMHASQLTCM
jgi:hypothetical protein